MGEGSQRRRAPSAACVRVSTHFPPFPPRRLQHPAPPAPACGGGILMSNGIANACVAMVTTGAMELKAAASAGAPPPPPQPALSGDRFALSCSLSWFSLPTLLLPCFVAHPALFPGQQPFPSCWRSWATPHPGVPGTPAVRRRQAGCGGPPPAGLRAAPPT